MAVQVTIETPLQDDVRDLVEALNAYMLPFAPPEFQFTMTVEQMAEPETTVFVARDENGYAIGCGALKMHEDGVGELKRMFTRPEVRGKRVGSALVNAISDIAKDKGVSRLVLETGTGPGFDGAWRLYENSGFARCGVVLGYPESEYSAFFEKRLAEAH